MAAYLDYAALSALVYNDSRGKDNKLTAPAAAGWSELPVYPNGITSTFTGFNARAYSNGTEIVIAYEGTDTDTTSEENRGQTTVYGFQDEISPRPYQ